jgi:hypothetical protein
MKVCEVCGALQQAGDADKRLTMHLEGKLHTGYAKIRKKLNDLKVKRANDHRSGRYDRSRSRSPRRHRHEEIPEPETLEKVVIFSSKKYGSGKNVPQGDFSQFKFADLAMEQNQGYSGASVAMDNTSLGKEWKYYKRELDQIRRKAKKEAERAEKGFARPDFRSDFRGGGNRNHHREGGL